MVNVLLSLYCRVLRLSFYRVGISKEPNKFLVHDTIVHKIISNTFLYHFLFWKERKVNHFTIRSLKRKLKDITPHYLHFKVILKPVQKVRVCVSFQGALGWGLGNDNDNGIDWGVNDNDSGIPLMLFGWEEVMGIIVFHEIKLNKIKNKIDATATGGRRSSGGGRWSGAACRLCWLPSF